MEKELIYKKIQLYTLISFMFFCVLSTLVFKDNFSLRMTEELLLYPYNITALLVTWYGELGGGVNPVAILPGAVLLLKFLSIVCFFCLCLITLFKSKTKGKIITWVNILISGIIIAVHFISLEGTTELAFCLKKIKVSYMLGIITYPLVFYYLFTLLLTCFLIFVTIYELVGEKKKLSICDNEK